MIKGDAANPPADGKVLTAINGDGKAKWGAFDYYVSDVYMHSTVNTCTYGAAGTVSKPTDVPSGQDFGGSTFEGARAVVLSPAVGQNLFCAITLYRTDIGREGFIGETQPSGGGSLCRVLPPGGGRNYWRMEISSWNGGTNHGTCVQARQAAWC
jgi:hypothetical protein